MKELFAFALLGLTLVGCASTPPMAVDLGKPATKHNTGGPVYSLAWGSDGRIASAIRAGVKLWTPQESSVTTLAGHQGYVWGVAWSPGQTYLATGGWDGILNVWNGQTGEAVKTFTLDRLAIWCVAWSPDGTRVAAGADNGTVNIYTVATGEEATHSTGSRAPVLSLAWSPQGNALLVGDNDGVLTQWSTKTWEVERTFTVESDRMRYDVNGIAWSPNGRWFATAHQDGWVRVWDPNQEVAIASFQQQKGWIRALAWGADSRTLAAGGEDGSLSVWDFPTKTIRWTAAESALTIWSAAWSPDSTQLAAGTGLYLNGDQGEVLVWSSPSLGSHP